MKFKDLCEDMAKNRGYKLFDLSVYLNQFEEVQIAAVWHNAEVALGRVDMPIQVTGLEKLVYSTLMIPYQIPGVCLLVLKDNKTIINQAFGFANVRLKVKASTSNLHRIASVSKVLTHAAIMQLVSEGKLELSAKVFPDIFGDDYNYSICQNSEQITVQHLLDHTVGTWSTLTR